MQDELRDLIVAATSDFLPAPLASAGSLSAETRLFGEEGLLDSMSLVSLVVAIEQAIEERFGVPIALADERALSLRASPYRTIGTLAAYAANQLAIRGNHG